MAPSIPFHKGWGEPNTEPCLMRLDKNGANVAFWHHSPSKTSCLLHNAFYVPAATDRNMEFPRRECPSEPRDFIPR